MSNQKKHIPKKGANIAAKPKQPVQTKQSSMSSRDRNFALLAGVAVITFICFHYTLSNQFLNWDDWIYVTKDKYITSFTAANINSMLFHDITLNYYHPLTMLSLALNYQFSQLSPMGYYFTNVLLHIINAILIFYFTRTLMEAMVKVGYKAMAVIPWLLAVGSLIHGIHPMHVESVAWISERKDLMYSVFYFAGLMMYVRYTQGVKFKWMLYVNIVFALGCLWGMVALSQFTIDFNNFHFPVPAVFGILLGIIGFAIYAELKPVKWFSVELLYVWEVFFLSLMGKPMAVSFPLSLFAIDYLLKRDLTYSLNNHNKATKILFIINKFIYETFFFFLGKKIIKRLLDFTRLYLEKWLFFFVAVLSGLQSVILEIGHNTVVFTHGYTVIQKLLISSYAFMMYTVDAFYPANLCSYYPYPGLTSEHFLPTPYYVAPLIALAIILIPLYLVRKDKDLLRVVLFGIGFYFANLVFILQFLSAGTTIMSDRYSYVSYFGLIFLLVYFAHWLWYKNKAYHIAIQGLLAVICAVLGYMCYERTFVWHNPETFWTDVINKSHETSQLPYLNLGDYYADSAKYDKAYAPYVTLLKLHTDQPGVYRNLGNIYGMRKQFDSSIYCFNMALKYDSTDATIYDNRGVTYANLGKFDLAIKDFNKAYALDTTQDGVLTQRASMLAQLGQYQESFKAYTTLIRRHPKEPSFYMQRGNTLLNGGNPAMALKDYQQLLQMQPTNGQCMYNISLAYDKLSDEKDALDYASKALASGFKVPDEYLSRLHKVASR